MTGEVEMTTNRTTTPARGTEFGADPRTCRPAEQSQQAMSKSHTSAPRRATLLTTLRVAVCALPALCAAPRMAAQDAEFSQTYQAPLYLSPSFAGLTNGTRFALNYRNQWPGVKSAFQNYAFSCDHFFDRFHSGLGLSWVCDNQGKGMLMDHTVSLSYAYEFAVSKNVFLRPGLSFDFRHRSIDQTKMVTWTDISSDGLVIPSGGSSINIERGRVSRFDASVSCMVYNDDFWAGVTVNHLVQPDVSFTDAKDKVGIKFGVFGGYRITYRDSYRGSEPRTITISAKYHHQYQYNQLELGVSWYFYPIEVGVSYRGLFVPVAGEVNNNDAVIPNLAVNIGPFRVGYSYDLTVSKFSAYGNGAHEASLIYRLIPFDVARRSYKMKPVPCSEPIMGYSYSGSGNRAARQRRGIHR